MHFFWAAEIVSGSWAWAGAIFCPNAQQVYMSDHAGQKDVLAMALSALYSKLNNQQGEQNE